MIKEIDCLLKILADPNRLRILKLLQKQPMCVCELTVVLGVSQPAVSRHLNKLRGTGLIECKKTGLWTDYFLAASVCGKNRFLKYVFAELEGDKLVSKDRARALKLDRKKLCRCR